MKKIILLLLCFVFISSCNISTFTKKPDFNKNRLLYTHKDISEQNQVKKIHKEIITADNIEPIKRNEKQIINNKETKQSNNIIKELKDKQEKRHNKKIITNYRLPFIQNSSIYYPPDNKYDETPLQKALKITAFIAGLLGILLLFFGFGWIFSIIAIVFGIITMNTKMGRAGLILGIVGIIISLLILILAFYILGSIFIFILGI